MFNKLENTKTSRESRKSKHSSDEGNVGKLIRLHGGGKKKKVITRSMKPKPNKDFTMPHLRPTSRKMTLDGLSRFSRNYSPIREEDEEAAEENEDYFEAFSSPPKQLVASKEKSEYTPLPSTSSKQSPLTSVKPNQSINSRNESLKSHRSTVLSGLSTKRKSSRPSVIPRVQTSTGSQQRKISLSVKTEGKSLAGQVIEIDASERNAPSPVSWIDPDEDSTHLLSETDYYSNSSQEGFTERPLPAIPRRSSQRQPKTSHYQISNEKKISGSSDMLRNVLSQRPFGSIKTSLKRRQKYSVLMDEEWGCESRKESGSVVFPTLLDIEKQFHQIVVTGDATQLRHFLADHPTLNINCVNYQNSSAIHVALRELNMEMVCLLMGLPDLDVSDVVLCAVKIGDLSLLTTVLGFLDDLHPGLEFAPCPTSVEFGDDLTPLILAAQEGKFEIVDLLIQRGHRMPHLHPPFCTCQDCSESIKKYDHLKYSTIKMNQYRAVTSPSYLFQTSSDPILRSFELSNQLEDAKKMFPQFRTEYELLKSDLRIFSAELIGCCRNAEEVEIVLKQPAGCAGGSHLIYPRLQLAIDCTQKEFVAHPNVQAVLVNDWTGGDEGWKKQSDLLKMVVTSRRLVELPFVLLASCFVPHVLARYSRPVHKFISAMAMFLLFLLLILLLSSQDKTRQKRGPPSSGVKWAIVVFVIGYVWCSLRVCFMLGYRRFFSIGWNCYDCMMNLLFLLTFVFWWAAYEDVSSRGDADLPRRAWDAYDPTLIAEGLFVIPTIMAFCRLYLPISLNYYLGPLMIAIGKMTTDIFQYIFMFVLLIVAWTVGLSHFYQAYDGMIQTDPVTKANTTQVSSFVNYPMTLKTLFWAIFGMSSMESADVIIENLEGVTVNDTIINRHNFTEGIGYFAFAIYQFLAVVVMLNMLVACMSNTFTKVVDNVPLEWVFGRTKIYLMYMYHGNMPPPFNLIPTLASINTILKWCSLMVKSDPESKASCTLGHCCFIERVPDNVYQHDFSALMSQLAQRYICMKEDATKEDPKK